MQWGMSRAARKRKRKEEFRREQVRSAAWDTDKELTAAAAGRETTWFTTKQFAMMEIGGALLRAAVSFISVAISTIVNIFR